MFMEDRRTILSLTALTHDWSAQASSSRPCPSPSQLLLLAEVSAATVHFSVTPALLQDMENDTHSPKSFSLIN